MRRNGLKPVPGGRGGFDPFQMKTCVLLAANRQKADRVRVSKQMELVLSS